MSFGVALVAQASGVSAEHNTKVVRVWEGVLDQALSKTAQICIPQRLGSDSEKETPGDSNAFWSHPRAAWTTPQLCLALGLVLVLVLVC